MEPENLDEFRSQAYWEKFFKHRAGEPFEWYGDWQQLGSLVKRRVGPETAQGSILQVGCGNSELSAQMYDDGFQNITNIDFSKGCIAEMIGKNLRARPKMRWLVMDALAMKLSDGSFDLVFDKGALDALMGEPGPDSTVAGRAFLSEVARVTKAAGGLYMCVSLLQDHVLQALFESLSVGWELEVTQVPPSADMLTSPLQPFLVVATASSPNTSLPGPHLPAINFLGQSSPDRCINRDQVSAVMAAVKAENTRRATGCPPSLLALRPGGDAFKDLSPGRRVIVEIGEMANVKALESRFRLSIVDGEAGSRSLAAAVFLVPQGREHEWMFGSEEGQQSLRDSAGTARLIVVSFGRGHVFGSTAEVQAELSPIVLSYLPAAARANEKSVPFMTIGGNGLGRRTIVAEAVSALTGRMMVEDVELAGEGGAKANVFRRLLFASNTSLVQSEVRMVPGSAGLVPDGASLACGYHCAILACMGATLPNLVHPAADKQAKAGCRIAVVGLGGGQLPSFLARFVGCHVSCVELDPVVASIAVEHFGFDAGPRLQLAVGDGIAYVADQAAVATGSLDGIIVDANTNDVTLGMSCPPEAFVSATFLSNAKSLLKPAGALFINVVARSEAAFAGAAAALKKHFEVVLMLPVPDDVNRVLVGLKRLADDAPVVAHDIEIFRAAAEVSMTRLQLNIAGTVSESTLEDLTSLHRSLMLIL